MFNIFKIHIRETNFSFGSFYDTDKTYIDARYATENNHIYQQRHFLRFDIPPDIEEELKNSLCSGVYSKSTGYFYFNNEEEMIKFKLIHC